MKSRAQRRSWMAVAVALAVHAVLLGALGLSRPRFTPLPVDNIPDIQIELQRPTRPKPVVGPPPPPAQSARAQSQAKPTAAAQPQAPSALNPRPAQTAPPAGTPALAADIPAAPPGCATEDLLLLNDQEKAHCREAMAVLEARRAALAAEAARLAAIRQGPKIDAIDPEKRVEYDAVVAGRSAERGNFDAYTSGTGGKGMHCTAGGRGRYVPPGSIRIGPLICAR